MRFSNPQRRDGPGRRAAPPLADRSCQVRVSGDLALLPGGRAGCCSTPRRPHPGTVLDHEFIDRALRRLRRATPPHLGRLDWDEVASRDRADPRPRSSGSPGWCVASQRIIVCWAMGLTQHRNAVADDPGDRQLAAAAGQHRPARRRASARCAGTATSRATGRWASGRSCRPPSSTRCATSSASSRPAQHGYDTVDAIRAMRDGRRRCSSPWAATSSRPRPDTDGHRGGAAQLRADRAGVDEAEPLARGAPATRR